MAIHLFEVQFAWFFSGGNQIDYERLVSSVRQVCNRPFVSPATYIPLPAMAPPEIPRAQLQTQDNSSRMTISLNRADFFVSSINSEISGDQIASVFRDVVSLSELLLSHTGIVRLGFVGRLYKPSHEPEIEIAQSLLKREVKNLQEASVKIVERHVSDKFTYNDSYQFDQGMKLDTQQKILLVTRDINTAPDVPLNVNMEVVREFVALAKERLDFQYVNKIMGA